MKHPIFNNFWKKEIKLKKSKPAINTFSNLYKDNFPLLKIDNISEWDNKISINTLSEISFDEFKIPLKTLYVEINEKFDFITIEKRKLDEEKLKSLVHIQKCNEVIFITLGQYNLQQEPIRIFWTNKYKTVKDLVEYYKTVLDNTDFTVFKNIFYAAISLVYYFTHFRTDKERVIEKTIHAKALKKRGIPRHTINLIKLKQRHVQKYEIIGKQKPKFEKMWLVKGHWRNQYYKTLGKSKPIWIDPYWKGLNNTKMVQKTYNIITN